MDSFAIIIILLGLFILSFLFRKQLYILIQKLWIKIFRGKI